MIASEEEYNKALKRIEEIFFPKNQTEEDELMKLVSLVEDYEKDFTG